jgi:general secretion pathway protein G
MQNRKRRNNGREGMTLLEVMLVLLILMTLATVGMLAVREYRIQARNNLAKIGLGELASLLEHYEGNIGHFPSTDEGLQALCECPPSVDPSVWFKIAKWNTPPLDPWGNNYNYQYPGSQGGASFDLWSSGPDGASGTEDDIW